MDILEHKDTIDYLFSKHRLIRELLHRKYKILYSEKDVLRCILEIEKMGYMRQMIERNIVEYISKGIFLVENEFSDKYYLLSKKIISEIEKENSLELIYELGRGGESIAFCAKNADKEYAVVLTPRIFDDNIRILSNLPKELLPEILSDKTTNIPLYKGYVGTTRIMIMQKMDMTLSEKIDETVSKSIEERYSFAYNIIFVLYDMVKKLAKSGHEHTDLRASNIGYVSKDDSYELKFIDLSSIHRIESIVHPGWMMSVYYELIETLDLASVEDYGDIYPRIIGWNYKYLPLMELDTVS